MQKDSKSLSSILSRMKNPGIVTMPPDFDEVQLTEEEKELVIFDARCEKYWDKKKREKQLLELSEIRNAMAPFTSEQLKEFVLQNNPTFKVDKQVENIFNLLCLYFTGDKKFEDAGYSLQKGICICGPIGVGKTDLLKIFQKNKRQCFHLISVYEIESTCQERGAEKYLLFCSYVPGWGGTKNNFFQKNIGWVFDDIGRESVVFNFGNKSDVVSKIIQTRYMNRNIVPFSSLHITSNFTPDELERRYDSAVRSRMREMFNYINYEGTDRRK